ncbi:MAG: HU family DNA-binding protein [Nitrospinae bacterium]|nr:HU family DNA-binding protein [Nitrospinota bacterium]
MTKADLIEAAIKTAKAEISKAGAGELIDAAFDAISKTIKKDGRFSYPGFGTFNVKKRKARTGRNPKTGESIKIKASKTVGFKPTPKFKSSL